MYGSIEFYPKPDETGRSHAHLGIFAPSDMDGEAMEDYATELADAVANCNSGGHNGHGFPHNNDDIQDAFRHAVTELSTKTREDYAREWHELSMKIINHEKWGRKQMPAAFLMPDEIDPRDWTVVLTNQRGEAFVHDVPKGILGNEIPHPEEGVNAVKGKYGGERKRRWRTDTRIRKMK